MEKTLRNFGDAGGAAARRCRPICLLCFSFLLRSSSLVHLGASSTRLFPLSPASSVHLCSYVFSFLKLFVLLAGDGVFFERNLAGEPPCSPKSYRALKKALSTLPGFFSVSPAEEIWVIAPGYQFWFHEQCCRVFTTRSISSVMPPQALPDLPVFTCLQLSPHSSGAATSLLCASTCVIPRSLVVCVLMCLQGFFCRSKDQSCNDGARCYSFAVNQVSQSLNPYIGKEISYLNPFKLKCICLSFLNFDQNQFGRVMRYHVLNFAGFVEFVSVRSRVVCASMLDGGDGYSRLYGYSGLYGYAFDAYLSV